ncbi:MAG TPA: PQQ-binding-like beta-propeller repeat protein [Blastocatellia bacterium]|nr:PQQ-binding-like beta-propeller repeat protein [Blastocatellia bacterium]
MKPSIKQGALFALVIFSVFAIFISNRHTSAQSPARVKSGSDWADWRGPTRDGHSYETGLPEKWSPKGENLLWKAPYGGRSAPIVMNDRVFMFNSAGDGAAMQERVLCLDADTGKKIWEYRFNVYSSDVATRRIAWSAPVGDPATGAVYVFGAADELIALSNDGKLLWNRSLTDEYGAWTTHGGRTASPIIEGDLIIVSTISEGWGDNGPRAHRFYAFDKRTGETVWISKPGGRPYDTVYPTPIAATINGARLIFVGGADGAENALKAQTGEPVWNYPMTKRGINNCAVVKGAMVFASHSEENYDTNEMGMLVAIDATGKGKLDKDKIKWSVTGFRGGYSSPVIDGDRLYQLDDSAVLNAFDLNTGKRFWEKSLGISQRSSPVFADGKLYVGTEAGKFYILKPSAEGCQVLSENELEPMDKIETKTEAGDDLIAANEQIIGSVAVSRGRIFLVSTKNIYAIGKKAKSPALPAEPEKVENAPADAATAYVQIVPADLVMKPGETAKFRVRLFDDHGRLIREESNAASIAWAPEGLKGTAQNNQFTAAADAGTQAGKLKATVGGVSGFTNVRVIPPSFAENFDSYAIDALPKYWVNATPKYAVKELDGAKVLQKNADNPAFQRARTFFGSTDLANYTVEADVRATEKRRQMGDAGVVAQRYQLTLFGNSQRLEMTSWQIEPARTIKKPFEWKKDTWYRLKLEVVNLPDGKARVRGKAWAAADAEPAEWALEYVDPIAHKRGSPGIFAYAPSEVFFDNIKVTPNK